MKKNNEVYESLGLPKLVTDMRTSAKQNMKRKGTDREACDEYIPENEGEDDSDDSSEVHKDNLFTTYCLVFMHIKIIKLIILNFY